MHRMTELALAAFALAIPLAGSAAKPLYKNSKAPVEARVADLLQRMTPEEKAGQLQCFMGWEMYEKSPDGKISLSDKFRKQNSGSMPPGSYWAVLRADPWTQKTIETGLSPRESARALNLMQRYAVDSTRLGIPILFAEELVHGHMAVGTTVFPTGLSMASTWDPQLIEEAGRCVGTEGVLQGVSIGYGPVLDVARDPRWSRMEETFGEDPWLSGVMGTAYMKGMQSAAAGPRGRGMRSTLKHFAAYGVPDGGHNGAQASVGQNELLSQLLPGFRRAVKEGAGTIMTSYNTIDGVPASAHTYLLTDVLRNDWGFDGFVYSDLFSIDGIAGRTAADRKEAGAQALKAGVDMDLGAACYGPRLLQALDEGLVSMADIDRAVARVLRTKFATGLFDNPYVDERKAAEGVRTSANLELSRRVAEQGTVLLKNDGILPFPPDVKTVAVIGPNADAPYNQLGDYTAPQPEGSVVTLLEGVRRAVSPSTVVNYVKGCAVRDTTASDIEAAVQAAAGADAVIMVVGGSSARDFKTTYAATGAANTPSADDNAVSDMDCGEGFDRATLNLLGHQEKLLRAVLATGKPVAVVYIQGRTLDMNLAAEKAGALLTAWYPGGEGGQAVADIIFGHAEPSGRLPVSIQRSVGQLPVYYYAPSHSDYMDFPGKPLYPFGHGLTYTDFEYSDLSVEEGAPDGTLAKVRFRITNKGNRKGTETPQLYVRDVVGSVAQPPLLLKAFTRVTLEPGDSGWVEFALTDEELAVYNNRLERVVEPGEFLVMVGPSSAQLPLRGKFTVK